MTAQASITLWVLLAGDAHTGAATRPVGVVGIAGDDHQVSWVPLEPGAAGWRDRVNAPSAVPLAERLTFWAEHANGLTFDVAQLAPAGPLALPDAVEVALDALLVAEVGG